MDKIKKKEDSLEELNEIIKNYREMNCLFSDFVYDVRRKTRLAWRYLNDMIEGSSGREHNRYNVAQVTLSEEGDKVQHIAKLVDGFFIDTEDIFSLENILYDINERAIKLNNCM